MIKHLQTDFVIADGSRARFVRRNESGRDFATIRELTAAKAAHTGGPQGVAFEGGSGRRASIEEKDTAVRARKGRFPAQIAGEINAAVESGRTERFAVIAPTRTLAAIVSRLNGKAQERLAGTLAKDLAKTPDHDLGHWLLSLELG